MSEKSDYTAEQWDSLVTAPIMAGTYVMTADIGLTSVLSETKSMTEAIVKGQPPAAAAELVASIVADVKARGENRQKIEPPDLPEESKKDPEALKTSLLGKVKEAVGIVASHGSADEAVGYAAWISAIARATAEAAKEGGFMGIGGTRVSEKEQAALEQLADAMAL